MLKVVQLGSGEAGSMKKVDLPSACECGETRGCRGLASLCLVIPEVSLHACTYQSSL